MLKMQKMCTPQKYFFSTKAWRNHFENRTVALNLGGWRRMGRNRKPPFSFQPKFLPPPCPPPQKKKRKEKKAKKGGKITIFWVDLSGRRRRLKRRALLPFLPLKWGSNILLLPHFFLDLSLSRGFPPSKI